MARPRVYSTLYERIVANTAEPINNNSCWEWTGHKAPGGYGKISVRGTKKSPTSLRVHRLMIEELLNVLFPFDEAGHLCGNPSCVNPDHLEAQTSSANLAERKIYKSVCDERSWIPTLFPRIDPLQRAADEAWDSMFSS